MGLREHTSVIEASGEQANEALASLHRELFTPAWTSDDFAALIAHAGSIALLARSGDGRLPVGFILGRVAADEAEILTLGVSRRAQRQGLGARLVAELARRAAEHGATRLFLEVAADNTAARLLYQGQGFSEVGRRPGYYTRPRKSPADAIIMSKTINR